MVSVDAFGDEDGVGDLAVLHVAVVEHALEPLVLLEVPQVVRRTRVDYVVPDHHRPLLDHPQSLQLQEVRQVQALQVVDEHQVEAAMLPDELPLGLHRPHVHGDAVGEACVLVDALGDAREGGVELDAVHAGLGVVGEQQGAEAAVPAQLEDGGGVALLEDGLEDLALLLPHVHHPLAPAEAVDALDDGGGVVGRSAGQHELEQHGLDVGRLRVHLHLVLLVVPHVLAALLVRHGRFIMGDHLGLMSKSKMLVGMETVQQALGRSTMLLMRPSMGAQLRIMQACSAVKPKFLRQLMALRHAIRQATFVSRQCCTPCSSTLIPSKVSQSEYCGPNGPGWKIGFLTEYFFMPSFITFTFISIHPAISIAPQKVISPSPWQKWMSPTDSSPPFTYTGRNTFEPTERSFMSQLPPCSRGGIVLSPSLFTLYAYSPRSLPTVALFSLGSSAKGGTLFGFVCTSFVSLSFQALSSSMEGAQPIIPGCGFPASLTCGTCREVAYLPSMSQIALCARGKWSVRKPPPFSLGKMPVKPHSESLRGPMSSKSTSKRSPGSAPSTCTGPLRQWICPTSVASRSFTQSLFLICPPEQSRHYSLKTSPGVTEPTEGMSGCHRLCRGTGWSRGDLKTSTDTMVRGGPFSKEVKGALDTCRKNLNIDIISYFIFKFTKKREWASPWQESFV